MLRWVSAIALVAGLGAIASACAVGKGEGWVRGEIQPIGGCDVDLSHYDMEADFFAANAVNGQMLMRIQQGGDFQEYADSVTIAVQDVEEVNAHRIGTPITVELERPPGSPVGLRPPLVRMSLSLRGTCGSHTFNPLGDPSYVVLHATSGTVTFTSILHGDVSSRDTNSKRIEGTFDVTIEDPRNYTYDDTVARKTSHLTGAFKFFYQRGGPAQPFP
ncbi:MAG: hypothetical protein ABI175_10790 [Polyangiales bacterium]